MTSVQSIKLNFNGEMRRISLQDCFTDGKPTMEVLTAVVRKSFQILSDSSFSLQYQDEDKDLITVTTDAELEEALCVAETLLLKVVRFDVVETKGKKPEGQTKAVHKGVRCDVCRRKPIVGIRYKCSTRPDYDLCEACEAKDASPHAYLKIVKPSMAPAAILTVLRPNQARAASTPAPAAEPSELAAALVERVAAASGAAVEVEAASGGLAAPARPVHREVICDKSGMNPIVGTRYHIQGANFDVCEDEFAKLPEVERRLYVKIPYPGAKPEPCETLDDTTFVEGAPSCKKWVWKGVWTQEMSASRSETVNFFNANGHLLLHFNPRVANLVLNSKLHGGSWEREERIKVSDCGLVPGASVEFFIEATPEGFLLQNALKPDFSYLFPYRYNPDDYLVTRVEQQNTDKPWLEVAAGADDESADAAHQETAAAGALLAGGKFKGGLVVPPLVRLECVAGVREFGPFASMRKHNGTLILRDPRAPTSAAHADRPWKQGGCLRIGKKGVMDLSGNGGPWASYHVEPVASSDSVSLPKQGAATGFLAAMDNAFPSFASGGMSGGGGGGGGAAGAEEEHKPVVRLVCGNRKLCLAAVAGKLVGVSPMETGTHTHFRLHEALPFDVPDPTWEALQGSVPAGSSAAAAVAAESPSTAVCEEEGEAQAAAKLTQEQQAREDEEFARILQESWNKQEVAQGPAAAPPPPAPTKHLEASFLADVTVPDGKLVQGGQEFTKVWRLRNDSDVPFPGGVRLLPLLPAPGTSCPLSGPSQGVEVPCVLPLQEFTVAVPMVAPKAPPAGSNGGKPLKVQSVWRLAHPGVDGFFFGHKLWVEVCVEEEAPATVVDEDAAARERALQSESAAAADMSPSDEEEDEVYEEAVAEPRWGLKQGERLGVGERLVSCNGKFYAEMQRDGNLVVRELVDGGLSTAFRFGTVQALGYAPCVHKGWTATMQPDGNLVVRDGDGHFRFGSVQAAHREGRGYQTEVGGPDAYMAVLQDDGNLTVKRMLKNRCRIQWASSPSGYPTQSQLEEEQALEAQELGDELDAEQLALVAGDDALGDSPPLEEVQEVAGAMGLKPDPEVEAELRALEAEVAPATFADASEHSPEPEGEETDAAAQASGERKALSAVEAAVDAASEVSSTTGSLSPSIDWEHVEVGVVDENNAGQVSPSSSLSASGASEEVAPSADVTAKAAEVAEAPTEEPVANTEKAAGGSLDLSASMEGAALAGSALAESASLDSGLSQSVELAVKAMEKMEGHNEALGEWGSAVGRLMEMGFTDANAISAVCRVHCAGPDEVESKLQVIVNDLLANMPAV